MNIERTYVRLPDDLPKPEAILIKQLQRLMYYKCFCGNTAFCSPEEWQKGVKRCSCKGFNAHFPQKDITGMRFTRLVVTGWAGKSKASDVFHSWHCRCDCGNTKVANYSSLMIRGIQSCGCMQVEAREKIKQKNTEDLTGQRFGRLVVISQAEGLKTTRGARWHCQCDCGRTHDASANTLKDGKVTSCGCARRDLLSYDLTGLRFNRLVVTEMVLSRERRGMMKWVCQCDCGNSITATTSVLRGGSKTQCGKHPPRSRGLQQGKTFNLFTLTEKVKGMDQWKCTCRCGTTKEIGTALCFENSMAYSCGCTPDPTPLLNSLVNPGTDIGLVKTQKAANP